MYYALTDNKKLRFTAGNKLISKTNFGELMIAFLDADITAALDCMDAFVGNVISEEFEKVTDDEIEKMLRGHLTGIHPLFFHFFPLSFVDLRRLFSARLLEYYSSYAEIIPINEFRTHYLGLPYRHNNYFLEDSEVKLLYALLRKRFLEKSSPSPDQLTVVNNEITYLAERVRTSDKEFVDVETECRDILSSLIALQEELLETLYIVFDVENEDYKDISVLKRYYIHCLLKEREPAFVHKDSRMWLELHDDAEKDTDEENSDEHPPLTSPEDIMRTMKSCDALWVTQYPVEDLFTALQIELEQMVLAGTKIKYCYNCNRIFIPSIRRDERYCTRLFDGERTCRQLGYELKMKSDQILQAYRTAYKTQHARMQRNRHIEGYRENVYVPWVTEAKSRLTGVRTGKIKKQDFLDWLKSK